MSLKQDLTNAWDIRDRAEFDRLLTKLPAPGSPGLDALTLAWQPSEEERTALIQGSPVAITVTNALASGVEVGVVGLTKPALLMVPAAK